MKQLVIAAFVLCTISCSSTKSNSPILLDDNTFELKEISTNSSYGLSEKNPVEVGGVASTNGPKNERRYLNALTGPNGEKVSYFRSGSCCPIKSKNGMMGMAILDNYRVTWEGSKDTVSIYINMYDSGALKAPLGFGIKEF